MCVGRRQCVWASMLLCNVFFFFAGKSQKMIQNYYETFQKIDIWNIFSTFDNQSINQLIDQFNQPTKQSSLSSTRIRIRDGGNYFKLFCFVFYFENFPLIIYHDFFFVLNACYTCVNLSFLSLMKNFKCYFFSYLNNYFGILKIKINNRPMMWFIFFYLIKNI